MGVFANTGYSKNKLEMVVLYTSKNNTAWERYSFSETKVQSFKKTKEKQCSHILLNEIKDPKLFLFRNDTTCFPHTEACSSKKQLEVTLEKRGELFR